MAEGFKIASVVLVKDCGDELFLSVLVSDSSVLPAENLAADIQDAIHPHAVQVLADRDLCKERKYGEPKSKTIQ